MAAITPLQKKIIDDTPSRVVHEVRKQWNAMVVGVAALDASTATAEDVITVLQTCSKIVTTLELPSFPEAPTV
jgi:hypothetical protein